MEEKINAEHNTYLAAGQAKGAVEAIYAALEGTLEIPVKGNPDFWHGTFDQFTIDDARTLKAMAAMKPFSDRRAMIVETLLATTEAQQAILKLSEELSATSFLFLVVPTAEQILPTLRSRFIRLPVFGGEVKTSKEAQEFLSSTWNDRQSVIDGITKSRDQRAAYQLLEECERLLSGKKHTTALRALLLGKRRILEGVVPLKMTLETSAALLPRLP